MEQTSERIAWSATCWVLIVSPPESFAAAWSSRSETSDESCFAAARRTPIFFSMASGTAPLPWTASVREMMPWMGARMSWQRDAKKSSCLRCASISSTSIRLWSDTSNTTSKIVFWPEGGSSKTLRQHVHVLVVPAAEQEGARARGRPEHELAPDWLGWQWRRLCQ
eukprot:250291-Rhodomonas_salina.1